ncbi:MAG TPA: M20/M25/M40 family metallo-hydrolase [Chloroflexota bacterium]|nr:M20/M25/M40 family metallo-hydrolase [Chloroflexota bacterium]
MNDRQPFGADAVIELLTPLVALNSVNPSLVPGAPGESEIAHWIADWMTGVGIEAACPMIAPGRYNAIGRLKGSGGGRTLMLNGHIDTVALGGMEDPLTLRIDGDRAYGRGAYDMKGSVAAILLAVRRLTQQGELRGDVVLACVADEEYASLGTQRLLNATTADAAVVTEPTGLQVCVAHKGFAWIEIEVEGTAAHGSRPDQGVDAIGMTGEVLAELNRLNRRLAEVTPHPLLGHASLHASLIHGGQELSSYPARCLLQAERRTLPGETLEEVTTQLHGVLRAVEAREPSFRGTGRVFFWRDAFGAEPGSFIVQAMLDAAEKVLGAAPDTVGDSPWMDSAYTAAAGIPTVVFGPGGAGAHSDHEWVSIAQVDQCAQALVHLARTICA